MTTMRAKAAGRRRFPRDESAMPEPVMPVLDMMDFTVMDDAATIDLPQEFIDAFISLSQNDLTAVRLALKNRTGDEDDSDLLGRIFTVAHDLKGQGTSFGYPLITRAGTSLCRLIRNRQSVGEGEMALVETHLAAMETIFEMRIAGSSLALAKEMIGRLERMVERLRPAT
jgi:chemotaxis protein histidine kinase CheA